MLALPVTLTLSLALTLTLTLTLTSGLQFTLPATWSEAAQVGIRVRVVLEP